MKRIYAILAVVLLTATVWAQAPEKMSYQAIVRDASNQLVTSTSVGMQISILQRSASGTAVYVETQTPTTNANGLVTLEIGTGTVVSGDFTTIDWANGPYFIKTETDLRGGSNYTITGTSQLLSVPYALYAGTVENLPSGVLKLDDLSDGKSDSDGSNDGSSLFLGWEAGSSDDQSDNRNVGVGYYVLHNTTTGSQNTASGYKALQFNTTGQQNTASGYGTLYSNTSGNNNTASGYQTLYSNTSGNNNTASGFRALRNNTTGYSNVAVGTVALYNNTDRSNLVAIGDSALYHNGIGASEWQATKNTALGSKALYSNTKGYYNTALGCYTLYSNTTGFANIALGYRALYYNTTGAQNTALGNRALSSNTTGHYNTALGYWTLTTNQTGNNNTALGVTALGSNMTGNNNTALGYHAFYTGGDYSNSMALGYNAEITASNQVRIGNSDVTSIGGYANWTNVSDKRFKKEIKSNVPGLDFIMKLRPVTYYLDMDAIARFNNTPDTLRQKEAEQIKGRMLQTGFIAQEVEQAAKETGYEFSGVDAPRNKNGHYGLRYAEFAVPMVKAIQEQQEIIEKQQQQIDALKQQVEALMETVKTK